MKYKARESLWGSCRICLEASPTTLSRSAFWSSSRGWLSRWASVVADRALSQSPMVNSESFRVFVSSVLTPVVRPLQVGRRAPSLNLPPAPVLGALLTEFSIHVSTSPQRWHGCAWSQAYSNSPSAAGCATQAIREQSCQSSSKRHSRTQTAQGHQGRHKQSKHESSLRFVIMLH